MILKADEALKDIALIGPSKEGAQLEGSKKISKLFKRNIKTIGNLYH